MATNVYPTQDRTIDPYASYNSNAINRLTRIITNGRNCLYGPNDLEVTKDPSNPTINLILGTGRCFKDDVMFEITSPFTVDTTDPAFYISGVRDMAGVYYLTLKYTYEKAKPAPRASVVIFRPDQHGLLTSGYLFVKAFSVVYNPGSGQFETDEVYDWDPADPNVQRPYQDTRVGSTNTLPIWTINDMGRLIYVRDEDELYWGTDEGWESFSGIRDNTNTTGRYVGELGYFHSDGTIHSAISTDIATIANCVVMTLDTVHGKVRLYGIANGVQYEGGLTIARGDKLWLSQTTAGVCTNVMPTGGIAQLIGVCIVNNGDGTLRIWFTPGVAQDQQLAATAAKKFRTQLTGGSWVLDTGLYRGLVTHNLGFEVNVVHCYDNSTKKFINPADIEIIDTNSLRVWMPDNTHTIDVIVLG